MIGKKTARPLTDVEEADIQRQIAADPEDWESTDAEIAAARPFAEAFPELAASIKRGRPKAENPKKLLSLRLDTDVVEAYRRTGPGWQARINDALRKAVGL